VRRFESASDLKSERQSLLGRQRSFERGAIDELQDQIIRAYIVDLANMRMAERGKSAGLLLKSRAACGLKAL
jgi:hypothetical protein